MFSLQRFAQCGVVLAALTGFSNVAAAVPISSLQFSGGALQVQAGAGATPAELTFVSDFSIDAQNGELFGDLIGLNGSITGTYEFDDPAGNTIVALSSSTTNSLIINDVTGTFTADINLISLQDGGSIIGAIDFSSSSYTGSNADLIALNDQIQNNPNLTVTFQTLGGEADDIDQLFTNGTGGVAIFSGALQVTPIAEPAPLALLGLGLLCGVAYVSRRRSNLRS